LKRNQRILLIGPLPPPIGGVSIHISRISSLLAEYAEVRVIDDSGQCTPGVPNVRKGGIFKYMSAMLWSNIVHVHSGPLILRAAHIIFARLAGKRLIVTIHGATHSKPTTRALERFLFRRAHKIITVSERIRDHYRLHDVDVIPAFIPPLLASEPQIPESVAEWIRDQKHRGRKLIAVNAFRPVQYAGGDLYGIDMCIRLIAALAEKDQDAALLCAISDSAGFDEKIRSYHKLIDEFDLAAQVMLRLGGISFPRVIAEADLVVRPTLTDGDALTIREALHFGVRVVASDCVDRPSGTTSFRTASMDDFTQACMTALADDHVTAKSAAPPPSNDYLAAYRRVYGLVG